MFCTFLFFHILPVKLISVCVMGCLHVQGRWAVHFPQVSAWVPIPLKGNSEQTNRPVCLLGYFYCAHTNSFLQHEGQMYFDDTGYKGRFSVPPVPCRTPLCPKSSLHFIASAWWKGVLCLLQAATIRSLCVLGHLIRYTGNGACNSCPSKQASQDLD